MTSKEVFRGIKVNERMNITPKPQYFSEISILFIQKIK